MKKFFLIVIIITILCISCTLFPYEKTITVSIPQHPWENISTKKMWYSLKWTNGQSIGSLHIPRDKKSVSISIPKGKTIIICAYPLGKMNPLGVVINGNKTKNTFRLSQNTGAICSFLINIDQHISSILNYDKIEKVLKLNFQDYRLLNANKLSADIINGEISKDSFCRIGKKQVLLSCIPKGKWIPSCLLDEPISIDKADKKISLFLSPGIHYYINNIKNLELKISVENNGSCFCIISPSIF